MKRNGTVPLLLIALLLLAAPPATRAWGDEGHEIIGRIAEHYLTPAAREQVSALLATDTSGLTRGTNMASEATWADKYRDSDRGQGGQRYLQTREWHFIDIELDRPDADAACFLHTGLAPGTEASVGPADDCIVDKIDQFRRELSNAATSPRERLLALQFLLHLVGDVHQPLHAADHQDRGGNDVHVSAAFAKAGNLHNYWDTIFVSRLGRGSAEAAAELIAGISAEQSRSWSMGTAVDWAWQSYQIAKTQAYGKLPRSNARAELDLDEAYVANATDTVRLQLQRAGVRLAWLLNTALR